MNFQLFGESLGLLMHDCLDLPAKSQQKFVAACDHTLTLCAEAVVLMLKVEDSEAKSVIRKRYTELVADAFKEVMRLGESKAVNDTLWQIVVKNSPDLTSKELSDLLSLQGKEVDPSEIRRLRKAWEK